jgi:hypothetical protein
MGRYSVFVTGAHLPPPPTAFQPQVQQRCPGLSAWNAATGSADGPVRHSHGLWPLRSGHERRGELAQVNREIEHPKLKNLKRAAIVIAIYSLIFTGGATLLASMLIPPGNGPTSTRTT